ncbi:DNA (Cytosine-5-)-methyltransferase [Fusarium proliferatum]|nr:DNA (Cytosine-5-)-methyltransferase [Fusarium proliferatum]
MARLPRHTYYIEDIAAAASSSGNSSPETTDLTDEPQLSGCIVVEDLVNLTTIPGAHGTPRPHFGECRIPTIELAGELVQAGSFLRTSAFPVADCVAEFVLVRSLFRCQSTDNIRVCGTPFLGPDVGLDMIPVAPGDVCMLIDKDSNCGLQRCVSLDRSALVASHSLTFTNAIRTSPGQANSVREVSYSKARRRGSPDETVVRGVTQHEAGALARIPDDEIRASWRGEAAGAVRQGPYMVFDCFSGAGGVTCGAKLAGFKVLHAVDSNSEAIETYKANHPGVGVLHMPVDEVISNSSVLEGVLKGGLVDVLHCSPPCQPFSPAHTRASERDQDNVDALFACCELVKRLRPRIVTVEQTFGLTRPGHSHILHTFLSDFTQHGYSIRYRVARLWVWGVPQKRKRLLIIAAAPGEVLPTFPRDTHHPPRKGPRSRRGRKRRPWVTVGDAVRQVSARGDDQVPAWRGRIGPALDPDGLAATVLASGGAIGHPYYRRNLTLAELAAIQGFPPEYKFIGSMTSQRRQIGNAFPPKAVKYFYSHLGMYLDGRGRESDAEVEDLTEDNLEMVDLTQDDLDIVDITGDA